MSTLPHLEHVDLEDAGSLAVAITPEGAVIADLQVAPGWRIEQRVPAVGGLGRLLGRRTPAPAEVVRVVLATGEGTSQVTWEGEVARLPDGTAWEAARNRSGYEDPTRGFRLPGGVVRIDRWGGQLAVAQADPAPGWAVEVERPEEDGTEVIVRFRRGGDPGEVSEVIASLDQLGEEPPLVEREHSWVVRL